MLFALLNVMLVLRSLYTASFGIVSMKETVAARRKSFLRKLNKIAHLLSLFRFEIVQMFIYC